MTAPITRDELRSALEAGAATVIDALPAAPYRVRHLPGALNLVVEDADERAAELLPDREAPIVTYSTDATCGRGEALAERLEQLAYADVRVFRDGIEDWVGAGLPVETGAAGVTEAAYELRPVGRVESPLADPRLAPMQGDEGAPEAWLVFDDAVSEALADVRPGSELIVLTWLHLARRDVLRVHPRDDPANPEEGVFTTRSQDRPNPIGLHRVEVAAIDGTRVRVRNLEAVDGTPVVDVKPALDGRLEK